VSGELNYALDQSLIADMNAHFRIFYVCKDRYADHFVVYQVLLVTGYFVMERVNLHGWIVLHL
jgi:hypothetical protein